MDDLELETARASVDRALAQLVHIKERGIVLTPEQSATMERICLDLGTILQDLEDRCGVLREPRQTCHHRCVTAPHNRCQRRTGYDVVQGESDAHTGMQRWYVVVGAYPQTRYCKQHAEYQAAIRGRVLAGNI